MAKIIVVGDAMVIESAHALETIKTLEKYRPKALTLLDSKGENEIFRVGTTDGEGKINHYGASFGSVSRNGEDRAVITMKIPADVTDVLAYIEDTVGAAIINLNKVEEQFDEALAGVDADRTAIRESITIM